MSKKYRPLAPLVGELAEIFDFGLRGQKSAFSVTAFAVIPLPKEEASHSPAQKRQFFDSLKNPSACRRVFLAKRGQVLYNTIIE